MTSTTGLRETLDQKALEAAYAAIDKLPLRDFEHIGGELDRLRSHEGARAAIAAYLAALPSPNGSGEQVSDPLAAFEAYMAAHGLTGYAFGFEGGSLYLAKDGTGHFCFEDDDLAWEFDRGSEGPPYRIAKIETTEIIALRDKLAELFPFALPMRTSRISVDALANEIRRVDGDDEASLSAGALAEALMPFLSASMAGPVPEGRKPLTFVIQIEADNSERYAIFSTMEKAEAWAAKTPDLTHIFADLVIDMPEWGNEAVEQRQ